MELKEKNKKISMTRTTSRIDSTMSSVLSVDLIRPPSGIRGICRDELLTSQGKKIQLIKMLCLTALPNMVLWSFTLFVLIETANIRSSYENNKDELSFSVELGKMIHQLQRERDMSILYLSALGPETKTFLQREYMASDNLISSLTIWPVDFDTARSEALAKRENLLQHLSIHRQILDKDNYNIYNELDFYNYIIDAVISWLFRTISKGKYESVWKTLVAYLKITNGKQDVGVERALGTFFFVKGGFYDQEKFQLYNRRVHKFQAFYYTAQMYSDQVNGMYKEGYLSAGYNVTDIINIYRNEIQLSSDVTVLPDVKKAQRWFDNMTVYMDALFGIQNMLGDIVMNETDKDISVLTQALAINISCLVLVVIMFPVVIISTENLTSSIQRYALTLVNKTKELKKEKKRTDSLLYQMVPKPVADKLKKKMNIEAEYFKTATIFFSDVYEFPRITSECNPIEVVEILNKLYNFIDERLDSYDVYKVETINDCYMVASGLPNRNKGRHAVEIANLSIDLLKVMQTKSFAIAGNRPLQLRIGINTGPCMAGIIGTAMPRYCLFGDTINTASRMKSYSQPNRIHVSDTTHLCLRKHGYLLKKRGHIDIKGKGVMTTYWLFGKQSDSRLQLQMESDGTMEQFSELPGEITEYSEQENIRSVLQFPFPGRPGKRKGKSSSNIDMKRIDEDPTLTHDNGHDATSSGIQMQPDRQEILAGTAEKEENIEKRSLDPKSQKSITDKSSLVKGSLSKQGSVDEESHPVNKSEGNSSEMRIEPTPQLYQIED